MSVSELDLETGQRVALVKYGIDGLRLLQGNLATLLTELDGLKDTAAAIEAGEHESISHPHVCSVLHTLMRTASASVLLAELLLENLPMSILSDTAYIQYMYPHISCCLSTALNKIGKIEDQAIARGYIPIPEDFLTGPSCATDPLLFDS